MPKTTKKTTKKSTRKAPKKTPAKAKSKSPSPETKSSGNLSINALAGTGKSTTLEWAENGVPSGITPSDQQAAIFDYLKLSPSEAKNPNRKVRVACFNNAIAEELQPRFSPEVDVRNNHKLALEAVRRFLGNPKGRWIDGRKMTFLGKEIIGNPYDNKSLWPIFTTAIKLADMAKVTLTGNVIITPSFQEVTKSGNIETHIGGTRWEIDDYEIETMAKFYGIDIEDGKAIQYVQPLIQASIDTCLRLIDFNDMVWLPNVFGCRPTKVDRLYIDEMQDLNAAQHGMLFGTAEQYVIVGDRNQAIYGFAGADPKAMPRFEGMIDAHILPLTMTRRCPHSHVEAAKRHLPPKAAEMFQATPEAPQGVVGNLDPKDRIQHYRDLQGQSNLSMCRTNAPMVQACFSLWKENIPASIRGRDIAANLANAIKRCKADDNVELITKLTEEYEPKIEKLIASEKEDLASAKRDELDILVMFATETDTPEKAETSLYKMFGDKEAKENEIKFSTVHKAKGLEADHITILKPELLPHPGISKIGPFWAEQERNIAYVGETRGKQTMMYER